MTAQPHEPLPVGGRTIELRSVSLEIELDELYAIAAVA